MAEAGAITSRARSMEIVFFTGDNLAGIPVRFIRTPAKF
jgi:hypothetical protein